jgi:hypothetical protein
MREVSAPGGASLLYQEGDEAARREASLMYL